MADPKTCGPDPYWLLQAADDALTRCELRLPDSVSDENIREARVAVQNATPHLERHTARRLNERLSRFTEAS